MTLPPIAVVTVVSQPFGQNAYVAWREGYADCLIIDPGFEPGKIIAALERRQLNPDALLITHGHVDHIAGIGPLKQLWPNCPVVIGRGDADKLTNPDRNLSGQFGLPFSTLAADRLVDDGQRLSYAGIELEVREIPGHSTGHIVYICHDHQPPLVFGGDVLFAGSVGRTDFPDGDFDQLAAGIRQKLYSLPADTIIFPGHGLRTTIGHESATNPFVPG